MMKEWTKVLMGAVRKKSVRSEALDVGRMTEESKVALKFKDDDLYFVSDGIEVRQWSGGMKWKNKLSF